MGIQGDAQDLCAILDWTTRFWSRSDSYTWTNEFRFAVCQASKVLCASFEDADYDHRRYHMLAEIDYARRPSNAQEVRPFHILFLTQHLLIVLRMTLIVTEAF